MLYNHSDGYLNTCTRMAHLPGSQVSRRATARAPTWVVMRHTPCAAPWTSSRPTICCCASQSTTRIRKSRPARTSRSPRSVWRMPLASSSMSSTRCPTRRGSAFKARPMGVETPSMAARCHPGRTSACRGGPYRGVTFSATSIRTGRGTNTSSDFAFDHNGFVQTYGINGRVEWKLGGGRNPEPRSQTSRTTRSCCSSTWTPHRSNQLANYAGVAATSTTRSCG